MLLPEAGAFCMLDRGHLHTKRLFALHGAGAFFVIRAQTNTRFRRRYSASVDRATGVQCAQVVMLTGVDTAIDCPAPLPRIKYHDEKTGKTLCFLTDNFSVPALTVADLSRCRWQVEPFFKWIKQHLRIKSFLGTSANAVKSQEWIAISVYVLVAIIKNCLDLEASLYTILQILSRTLLERIELNQLLTNTDYISEDDGTANQLNLFDNYAGQ